MSWLQRLLCRWVGQGEPDYSGAFDENGDMLPHSEMVGSCPVCDAFGVDHG